MAQLLGLVVQRLDALTAQQERWCRTPEVTQLRIVAIASEASIKILQDEPPALNVDPAPIPQLRRLNFSQTASIAPLDSTSAPQLMTRHRTVSIAQPEHA